MKIKKIQEIIKTAKDYKMDIYAHAQKTNEASPNKETFVVYLLSNLTNDPKLYNKMQNDKRKKNNLERARDIKATFTAQELNWNGKKWEQIKLYCDFSSTKKYN